MLPTFNVNIYVANLPSHIGQDIIASGCVLSAGVGDVTDEDVGSLLESDCSLGCCLT